MRSGSKSQRNQGKTLEKSFVFLKHRAPKLHCSQYMLTTSFLLARQRQDSCQECAICMETFKDQTQVLLSCSHVFHQTCLASFERFSGRATCPLCRHADYEKRLFDEGRKNWEKLCTLKLQAVWRGHCGRKVPNTHTQTHTTHTHIRV